MRSDILQSCICIASSHSLSFEFGGKSPPEALFFETSLVCLISDTTREIPKGHRATGFPLFCVPCYWGTFN